MSSTTSRILKGTISLVLIGLSIAAYAASEDRSGGVAPIQALRQFTLHFQPQSCSTSGRTFGLPRNSILLGVSIVGVERPVLAPTWTTRKLLQEERQHLRAVIHDGSRFVAVGGNGWKGSPPWQAVVVESDDGADWKPLASFDQRSEWNDIIFTGTKYIAGGIGSFLGDGLFVSDDAAVWVPEPSGFTYNVYVRGGLAWDGTSTAAVLGRGRAAVGYSNDGGNSFNYVRRLYDGATQGDLLLWDGAKFVAFSSFYIGFWSGRTVVATSPDGVSWTEHHSVDAPLPNAYIVTAATDGTGRFAAKNFRGPTPQAGNVVASIDGINWTHTNVFLPNGATGGARVLAFEDGRFFATSDHRIFSSPDGWNWAEECSRFSGYGSFESFAASGDTIVAVGEQRTSSTGSIRGAISASRPAQLPPLAGQISVHLDTDVGAGQLTLLPPTDTQNRRFEPGETTRVLDTMLFLGASPRAEVDLDLSAGAGWSSGRFSIVVEALRTPADALTFLAQSIQALVDGGALDEQHASPLLVKIDQARDALLRGNPGGSTAALNLVENAFLQQLHAYVNNGTIAAQEVQGILELAGLIVQQIQSVM